MDLIDRQAAIDALKGCYCGGEDSCGEPWIYESHAIKAIKQLPPIQPKPLQPWEVLAAQAVLPQSAEPKRGRWIKLDMHRGMADHKCTACKQECYVPTCMGEPMYAYCPNCGAKMEANHESN